MRVLCIYLDKHNVAADEHQMDSFCEMCREQQQQKMRLLLLLRLFVLHGAAAHFCGHCVLSRKVYKTVSAPNQPHKMRNRNG